METLTGGGCKAETVVRALLLGYPHAVCTSMVSAFRRAEGCWPGSVQVVRATPRVPTFCEAASVSASTWCGQPNQPQQQLRV